MSDMERKNPEVMGRTEPRDVTTQPSRTDAQPMQKGTQPMQKEAQPMQRETQPMQRETQPMQRETQPTQKETWLDMDDVRMRFEQLQSEFIDEPRRAAQKAETLMSEAVDKITRSMRDRIQTAHRDIAGEADTEKLRLAMRNFKEMIESMPGNRRAA